MRFCPKFDHGEPEPLPRIRIFYPTRAIILAERHIAEFHRNHKAISFLETLFLADAGT